MNSGTSANIIDFLDFKNAKNQSEYQATFDWLDLSGIKEQLLNRIENVLTYLFPEGYVRSGKFYVGSIKGEKGKSLTIDLDGESKGKWYDFATKQGGDIITLWQEVRGYRRQEFGELLFEINEWLGYQAITKQDWEAESHRKANKEVYFDDLGKPTAKWDYLDRDNKLIACIYRYDTESGKEFRVWDVKNRRAKSPEIRPLYNIPGIISAKKIIIVEGEKSADALIAKGFAATTAMFGASAPIEKTDWSPLTYKEVIIWPDNDAAGLEYGQKLLHHLSKISYRVFLLTPPGNKPAKWDAFDAVLENFNIRSFLESAQSSVPNIQRCSIGDFRKDKSPMPEDLIMPRLLTPGGMLLIGGAPKVGKSDFLINFLTHLAAGESFLGLRPPRPLKIFYLQAEIGYHYMRERINKLTISDETFFRASENLIVSSRIQMILDERGIDALYRVIKHDFPDTPDIICIDPIRNVFDGGENGSENDNSSMLFFLQNRVEKLRSMLNPEMGIILCHHTKKIKKKDVEDDPFQAFSGAGSLRSFYSSGLILHRPSEHEAKIHLYFELRNGSSISKKIVEKVNDRWVELNPFSERLIQQDYGQKLDAERVRKSDVILQLITDEAFKGKVYTVNQFAERFENQAGLGCKDTINQRIAVLSTKGYIKFSRNWSEFSLERVRSKYGIMCVEGMLFKNMGGIANATFPTHYKCPKIGAILPVENPSVWVLHDDEVQP